MRKKQPTAGADGAAAASRPVTGTPAPNSDIFLFVNGQFRQEFEACAQLTPGEDQAAMVTFEADLVEKLDGANTKTYRTSLRVPRGCMMRAQMHPVFRRMLVQSMWLQMQPAMLRFEGDNSKPINPKTPVCACANHPPCRNKAVRFVGNPGFFPKKSMLLDPFCVPVCQDPACVAVAQQKSMIMHAEAQQQEQQSQQQFVQSHQQQLQSPAEDGSNAISSQFDMANNPALKSQMPTSVRSCNACGAFEQAYGGTVAMVRPCPLCQLSYYCSQECQIQDWRRGHMDVCVNSKTGKKSAEQIPDATTAAPAPAPAPMPITASAPAPAPMPIAPMPAPAPAPRPAPAPAPMPVTATQPQQQQPQLTQAMAAMAMPTYKMSTPAAVAAASSSPAYAMPAYNMQGASTASGGGVPAPVQPTYASPSFQAPGGGASSAVPINTTATETGAASAVSSSLPVIKKGRKKAE